MTTGLFLFVANTGPCNRPDSERNRAVDSVERATEADDEAEENGRAGVGDDK